MTSSTTITSQLSFFPELTAKFPSTRYQGSKAKLANWIWAQVADLDFTTCLDAFGGTGAVAYRLKQASKVVTYNDLLRFNYYIGMAFIENGHVQLDPAEVGWLLNRQSSTNYPCFVQETFADIYFTDVENAWIDQTITNIRHLTEPHKFALAFFALCQACIIKRPYNLFHRRNLYLRFAEVERSFGNKTTWDTPFDEWFRTFVAEANQAVFDKASRIVLLTSTLLRCPATMTWSTLTHPMYLAQASVLTTMASITSSKVLQCMTSGVIS
jgi:hypothetical protein